MGTAVEFRTMIEPLEDASPVTYRHWCPLSEPYTGGDVLLTALDNGWRAFGVVFCQSFWLAGVRRVRVYHLRLYKESRTERIAVIENPAVIRLIRSLHLQIVQLNQRRDMHVAR